MFTTVKQKKISVLSLTVKLAIQPDPLLLNINKNKFRLKHPNNLFLEKVQGKWPSPLDSSNYT